MNRREHYAMDNPEWDGTCCRCGCDYFENAAQGIRNGCLGCLAQWQGEVREGLVFDDDPVNDPDYQASVAAVRAAID